MTEASAASALKALDRRFSTGDGVRLAPLGQASGPGGPRIVLAGRFKDDAIVAVRRAIKGMGGTVVVDADERSPGNA